MTLPFLNNMSNVLTMLNDTCASYRQKQNIADKHSHWLPNPSTAGSVMIAISGTELDQK